MKNQQFRIINKRKLITEQEVPPSKLQSIRMLLVKEEVNTKHREHILFWKKKSSIAIYLISSDPIFAVIKQLDSSLIKISTLSGVFWCSVYLTLILNVLKVLRNVRNTF